MFTTIRNNNPTKASCTWKHFDRKTYSAFRSIGKEIRIGVLAVATLTFAITESATAQVTQERQKERAGMTQELEELEVTGSHAPMQANRAARIVSTISREEIAQSAAQSVNDVLKMALGVDVRQRGGNGIQTDICIDGGSFDQVTILLNGVNINSPQTGHLSADFPVSIGDIERVEVLEGAASRSLGGSSFSGAVNIVTRPKTYSHISVSADGGSYGSYGGGARCNYTGNNTSQQLTIDYKRSDGGTENSSFKRGNGFYQGNYKGPDVDLRWSLGYSNQDYGANTFYSASYPNQHEQNSRTFVAVKAATNGWLRVEPTVYWTRSTDHFELIRHKEMGENFHRSDVFGSRINCNFKWKYGLTSLGADVRNEGILSTNLGKPMEETEYVKIAGQEGKYYTKKDNRTNVSYFLEHNVLLQQFTISVGGVANMNSALDSKYRFYPGIDISYRPTERWKIALSWNEAFRMPTFTDLYYKSPTTEGNIGLKPEKTKNLMFAVKYEGGVLNGTVRAFYQKGTDMIDWVMYSADDIYHSANFKLDNMGVELQGNLDFRKMRGETCVLDKLSVGFSYINQERQDETTVYKSNYALEYLKYKVTSRLSHRIWRNLTAAWNFRWQDREGGYLLYENHKSTGTIQDYKPYALLDLKIQWTKATYTLYVSGNNLTNHTYYDFGNIPQAGLWIMAGGTFTVKL